MTNANKKLILRQIEKILQEEYAPVIDVSDLLKHSELEKKGTILSRGLAALALHHLTGLEIDQCGRLITDQPGDNGIDAVGFDPVARVLYIIQSKYFADGNGGVSTEGALKLIKGFEYIVNDEVENFGSKLRSLEEYITQIMDSAGVKYELVYVHSGDGETKPDQSKIFEEICAEFIKTLNPDAEPILSWKVIRLSDVYDWVRKQTAEGPINLTVDLLEWGEVAEPYAVYGQVKGTDITEWWGKHGGRLVEKNIRSFLGSETSVNRVLISTIRDRPGDFWHFNNGITIICESIQKMGLGRTREHAKFDARAVSIVNGAQTVATITEAHQVRNLDVAQVKVLARFIQVGISGSEDFSSDITRYTNTQNGISGRDFIALDPEQERIREELHREDVRYLVKRGDTSDSKIKSFSFDEAVVAVACAHPNLGLAVRAKRAVSDLWQDTSRGYYKSLFSNSTNGIYVWRAVQVTRIIDKQLTELRKGLVGRSRGFVVHGNRFMAHRVFQSLSRNFLDRSAHLSPEEATAVEAVTKKEVNLMLKVAAPETMSGYPAVFFKNQPEQEQLARRMTEAESAELSKT